MPESNVWTPVQKPPNPSSISLLSNDAQLVLEALREAHAQRLEVQQKRFQQQQAKDGRSYYHQIYMESFKAKDGGNTNETGLQQVQTRTPNSQMTASQLPIHHQSPFGLKKPSAMAELTGGASQFSEVSRSASQFSEDSRGASLFSEISRGDALQGLGSRVNQSSSGAGTGQAVIKSLVGQPLHDFNGKHFTRGGKSTDFIRSKDAPFSEGQGTQQMPCFPVNTNSEETAPVASSSGDCQQVRSPHGNNNFGREESGCIDILDDQVDFVMCKESQDSSSREPIKKDDGQSITCTVLPVQPCSFTVPKEELNKTPDKIGEVSSLELTSIPLKEDHTHHENLLSRDLKLLGDKLPVTKVLVDAHVDTLSEAHTFYEDINRAVIRKLSDEPDGAMTLERKPAERTQHLVEEINITLRQDNKPVETRIPLDPKLDKMNNEPVQTRIQGDKPFVTQSSFHLSTLDMKQVSMVNSANGVATEGLVSGMKKLGERHTSIPCVNPETVAKRKLIPVFSKPSGGKHKVKKTAHGSSEATLEQFVGFSDRREQGQEGRKQISLATCKSITDYEPADVEALTRKISDAELILMMILYSDGSSQLRERDHLVNRKRAGYGAEVEGEADSVLVQIQTPGKREMHSLLLSFPLAKYNPSRAIYGEQDYPRKILLEVLECAARKVCFDAQELMHTIILSYKVEPQIGCAKWNIFDPKIACWLLDPDHPPITFSQLLEGPLAGKHVLLQGQNKPVGLVHGTDLQMLGPVMDELCDQLKRKDLWQLFVHVEVGLAPILAAMEVQGVLMDADTLQSYGRVLKEHISEVERKCFKAAGHPFQINSHVQLRQILFDELKLDEQCPGQKLARTNVQNLKSTSETVLHKLKDVHPLPQLVLNYRQLVKLNSTYIDGLKECLTEGYIHTCWEQTSAASGRIQSSNPNIQNIPKQPIELPESSAGRAKDLEGAETVQTLWMRAPLISHEGWTFIAADWQSIELRILAHLSQDPVLLKIFNDQDGIDIFVQLTCEWLGMKPEDVKTQDRERTKRIVYSVVYGVGPERLAETLNISKDKAKAFNKSFLGKFKGLNSFTHRCISECQRRGSVRTIFQRHRLISNINSHNFHIRAHAERQAVNFVVQGSAADICKIAMIRCMRELSGRSHLRARLLVQIHDELLFEVHDDDVGEVKELLRQVMESTSWSCGKAVKLKVPLPVSLSVGRTWSHLKHVV